MRLGQVVPERGAIRGPKRLLLAVEIYLAYLRVRWYMRAEDATSAMERIRRSTDGPSSPLPESVKTLAGQRLGWAVVKSLRPLPTDSRCLFRSLTLTYLLERRGIESTLPLAVRLEPFAAHAWVERDGVPLLPPGEAAFERLTEL